MTAEVIVQLAVLGFSALLMLVNIVLAARLQQRTGRIRRERQQAFRLIFTLQQALMAFFLLGYLATIAALVMDYPLQSESFISFIFLFGSLFVGLIIWGQLQLIDEIDRPD